MFNRPRSKDHRLIHLHSLDADGCLFNRNYHQDMKPVGYRHDGIRDHAEQHLILRHNQPLWDHIRDQSRTASSLVVMLGSNRQSKDLDVANSNHGKTASAFLAIQIAENHIRSLLLDIPCTLDTYLLADTYGNVPVGTSFDQAMAHRKADYQDYLNNRTETHASKSKRSFKHPEYIFDHSKLSMVYAQLHKVAAENADARIVYTLYDDRQDLLLKLACFLNANPDLIPNNVTCQLAHYDGTHLPATALTILGQGEIDIAYQDSIREMAACATKTSAHPFKEMWNFIDTMTADALQAFRANRLARSRTTATKTNWPETSPNRLQQHIDHYRQECENNGTYHSEQKIFVTALTTLHQELTTLLNDPDAEKDKPYATRIILQTNRLLTHFNTNPSLKPEAKMALLKQYEKACRQHSRWHLFARALTAVVIAGVTTMIGAITGALIGVAAGAWSGPGAAATGMAGLFTGAASGAAIGIGLGATVTGLSAGAISGYLLFKPSHPQRLVNAVTATGKQAPLATQSNEAIPHERTALLTSAS